MGKAEEASVRFRAWRAIMVMHGKIVPVLDNEMREAVGVDVHTYDVLLHTYEGGASGIRMTDLAQKVVRTKSGLTAAVDRLEHRDLLQRVPDPKDRRATRIMLTEHGLKTFRDAAKVHMAGISKHFAEMVTDDDALVVAEILERIVGRRNLSRSREIAPS